MTQRCFCNEKPVLHRPLPFLLIGLIVFLALAAVPAAAASGLANSPMPKFHYDLNNTGRSPYTGPQTANVAWTYTTAGLIQSGAGAVISSDGILYIGDGNGIFYAINADGTLKWSKTFGSAITKTPAIASDGTIYLQSGSSFYAINPDGTPKWEYPCAIVSSPSIAPDGTIYVANGTYIHAINPDGTIKWIYTIAFGTNSYESPAIGSDGTIYLGCSGSNLLAAINPDGTLKWSYTLSKGVYAQPAVGPDGAIYFGCKDKYFYALNPDGTLKWKYAAGSSLNGLQSSPAIGSDGTIYFGSNDKKFYALNADGTLNWSYTTTGTFYGSSPTIGADGTIYIDNYNNKIFYALNPNGTLKWSYTDSYSTYAPPAIASDGTLYIGSGYTVYAFRDVTAVAPVANFTADNTTGTAPFLVTFNDTSSNSPTSWLWNFGDGSNSTEQNPTHTYSSAGSYTVTLTATNSAGSNTTSQAGYIRVANAATNNLNITGTVNPVVSSAVFAKETNPVKILNIKNTGTETVSNITVALYASDISNETPVNSTVIDTLACDTTTTATIIDPTIRQVENGSVVYTAVIDPDNRISETDESDNSKSSAVKPVRYNGYKGKRYWEGGSDIVTKGTYDLNGGVVTASQSSAAYKAVGWTDRTETWSSSDLALSPGATVEKAILYISYNWDTTSGGYPNWTAAFNSNTLSGVTPPYTDKSNFGGYGNYTYGLYSYDVTSTFSSSGNTLVMTPNTGNNNALYPSSLVVVYRDANETRKQIFINEECDELLVSESSYGTTLAEATAYAPFTGLAIDTANVTNATLYSFAGSAGSDEGNLFFNGNTIGTNYWQGSSSTANASVADVKSYLAASDNVAAIQGTSSGGMLALQQVLVVEYNKATVTPVITMPTASLYLDTPTRLPIEVDDLTSATGLSFSLTYDPTVIQVEGITVNDTFATGSSLNLNAADGLIRVSLTNTNGISVNDAAGILDINLTGTGAVGSSSALTVTDALWSDAAFTNRTMTTVSGSARVAYAKADFNHNGAVDIGDVARVAYMVVEKTPTSLAADFNQNGYIDVGDAAKIAYYFIAKISSL